MKTREERNAERREFEGDAMYQVWRSGGNPDRINYDRVQEHFHNGDTADQAAAHELRSQRESKRHQEIREEDEQFPLPEGENND